MKNVSTANHLIAFATVALMGQACQSDFTNEVSPATKSARASAAVIYSNDFESTPCGWSVYTLTWTQGYATTYAGSKRLDQANLYAVYNRTTYKPVIYSTTTAITFPATGAYTIAYSTITTATTAGVASIDFILKDAVSGKEMLISSVPLTSSPSSLTTRTATFSLSTAGQYFLRVVSSGNITPTPLKAGHCYIDNIVIR
ncbi:MAG: hypothetical protein U0Y10_21615 [Spirosomataceae bacterium]